MYLNRKHAEFDPAMELLCSLPSESAPAPMSALAADLELNQPQVQELLNELRTTGYDVLVQRDRSHHLTACITDAGWVPARLAGLDYWGRVNA